MEVNIKKLSPEIIEDYLNFFENVAFTDNKHWSGCFCLYYHFNMSNEEWISRKKEDNKAAAISFITEGKLSGYLAYSDNAPIGLCNINNRNAYDRKLSDEESSDRIASIVCFVIAPEYRKRGVASKLLDRLCSDYKELGYDYIEAYPNKGSMTNASQYHGPISMYNKAGFNMHQELQHCDIVRKSLKE